MSRLIRVFGRLTVICVTIFVSCNNRPEEHIEKYSNGNIKTRYHTIEASMEGVQELYYENGAMRERRYWKNNVLIDTIIAFDSLGGIDRIGVIDADGVTRWFDTNNRLLGQSTFVQGRLNGESIEYYSDGLTPQKKLTWRNGLKHGKAIEYYPSGKIFKEAHYEKDSLNGKYIEYDEEGHINKTAEYINGTLHGMVKNYRHGTLVYEGVFIGKQPCGEHRIYDVEGRLQKTKNYDCEEL